MGLDWVTQRQFRMEDVPIPTSVLFALDVMAILQIGHNPLHGSFRDADALGNITQPDFGVLC